MLIYDAEPDGYVIRNGGGIQGMPDDGSAYLQNFGGITSFAFINGMQFGITSVDLAAYSDVIPNFSTSFIGYLPNGSTVTTNFSGTGLGFRTLNFGPEFSGLIRLEIPQDFVNLTSWSLDNLAFYVPEPPAASLFVLSGFVVFIGRKKLAAR